MVNIDNVYQKVLVFANKEQRGYVTPQEFNMFASQAQLEIIEQYFYDINQFERGNGNNTEYSDMVTLIQEKLGTLTKIHEFPKIVGMLGWHPLPEDCYKIGTVTKGGAEREEIDEITYSEWAKYNKSRLTMFNYNTRGYVVTNWDPINNLSQRGIQVYPNNSDMEGGIKMSYVKVPLPPKWGYQVVGNKALHDVSIYDPNTGAGKTTHFELHPAEENELVYKILKYAGLSMKRDDIAKGGQGLESIQIQQEKQ
tara:strand:- start:930 stop:1688 length:759 start_codon:yes stop_codon:yes gene_type:complete